MSEIRLNAYHVMWLFVFFDLPTNTKTEKRNAALFRKGLEKDGFTMMQYSVYTRHCGSKESMNTHKKGKKTNTGSRAYKYLICYRQAIQRDAQFLGKN